MKHVRKIISKILIAALLLACGVSAFAVDFDLGGSLNTGGLNDLNVMQAVCDYMDTRAPYLLGEIDSMDWIVNGINNDEANHKAKLAEEGVVLNEISYVINSVACGDTMAIVAVNETVFYSKNGVLGTAQILHKITVMLHDDNKPVVVADGYIEPFSDFESCSYVVPSSETYSVNVTTSTVGSSLCIIQIALGEVDETERDPINNTNDNKYGEDLKLNFVDWCSIFVRWCAKEANVSETIIPFEPVCQKLKVYYSNLELFFNSPAYNGTYIPQPGDIVFKGASQNSCHHVGIVEKVEGNHVWIIDGNSIDENGLGTKVNHRKLKLDASDILGYGHPSYETTGHTSVTYSYANGCHSGTCINCGAAFEEECHMVGTSNNSTTHTVACTDCGNSYTALHYLSHSYNADNSAHWKKCINCDYKQLSDHSCNGAYDIDETSHSRICSICEHVVTQNHTYGSYTKTANTHSRTCNECQYSYTEAHNFVLNLILKVQICSDCGYSMAGPGVLDSMIPDEEYVTE